MINGLSTLALYCSRCGKIELHTISRFAISNSGERQLVCSCGQVQAAITASGRKQCVLRVPCPVCEVRHLIRLDSRILWQAGVSKIYCPAQNFELGFSGESRAVAQLIFDNCNAAADLVREMDDQDGESDRGNSRVILETLNKIHDIAELGGVYCRCGSRDIRAEVSADAVELTCEQCGGQRAVAARIESDLAQLALLQTIEIIPYRLRRRKH